MTELLEVWQRWSYRNLLTGAVARAEAAGNTATADLLRRGLDAEPPADPLGALAANQQLSSLLRGWQWHAIRAAREAGATWAQVAAALNTTVEQARACYLEHIDRAERHARGLTDTAPYRAVLNDPPRGTAASPVAGMGERPARPAATAQPSARPRGSGR